MSCHGPRYRGPHGDDHTVGHARPRRDATPGLALFEAIGQLLVICAVILLPLVIIVAAWHLAGWWGAGGATA
ncbi:MAG TPA: hypothetical protein DCL06_02695, partial [Corynebacterium variabile]|nr:hypothetical protein [Corynebacterium variabile]